MGFEDDEEWMEGPRRAIRLKKTSYRVPHSLELLYPQYKVVISW